MREEEPLDVKYLGTLYERGNLGRREMRRVEFLGGTQRRHQRPSRPLPPVNEPLHEQGIGKGEREKVPTGGGP